MTGIPVAFLRRVARMIMAWRHPSPLACPIHHIHGAKDKVIPVRKACPDRVVPGGGHLINLTHAPEVNRFILECL